MKELENFINSILPKTSEEDMAVAIRVLITKCNEDSRQTAIEDPLHKQATEVYTSLHRDAYECGLHIELAEFELEHPEMNIFEIDRSFRLEYGI